MAPHGPEQQGQNETGHQLWSPRSLPSGLCCPYFFPNICTTHLPTGGCYVGQLAVATAATATAQLLGSAPTLLWSWQTACLLRSKRLSLLLT